MFMCILVALTQYKDKFEKKISTLYDPSKLHFGKALVSPLVYVCFTVFMILDQSLGSFLLASIY